MKILVIISQTLSLYVSFSFYSVIGVRGFKGLRFEQDDSWVYYYGGAIRVKLGLALLSIGLGLISYRSEKKINFGFYGFLIGIVALLIIGIIFLIGIIWFLTLWF